MPRTCHYWRRAGATACPSSLLIFDTETVPTRHPHYHGGELHVLRLGVAHAYRLEKGRRTRQVQETFRTAAEFWRLVEARLNPERPLWLMAHNTAFDLGVIGGWERFAAPDCEWSTVILEGGICHLRGSMSGKPLVVSDTGNYYRQPLAVIGKSLGRAKLPMPGFGESDDAWETYCREDVAITADAIDNLIAFWREHELGPWGPTISSLAFNAYRHRFMTEKVLVHTNREALKLERAAYYGGRVDTPLIGQRVEGEVTECDFSSLYPSTYLEPLPYHLEACTPRPRPEWVIGWLRGGELVADVTVRTASDTYPCRVKNRVFHPIGEYRTALAGPELRYAIEAGHVRMVHAAAFYRAAPIFRRFAEFFYPLKDHYEDAGNEGFRYVVKLLLNSLYGKTGQQSPRWVVWGAECLRQLEEFHELEPHCLDRYAHLDLTPASLFATESWPELGEELAIRHIFGQTEVCVGRNESRDSCPAIAATVTSYGRVKLSHAQRVAGYRQWFYSDTDSVWCNATAIDRFQRAGLLAQGELGKLAVGKVVKDFLVHGRKDYEHDAGRRLKGIRHGVQPDRDGGYHQLHFPSAMCQFNAKLAEGVFLKEVVKHLRRRVDWCHVGPDGWTTPFRFPEDCP